VVTPDQSTGAGFCQCVHRGALVSLSVGNRGVVIARHKIQAGCLFFLVGGNGLLFKGQYVVYLNRPIPRYHDFFHQQLDHRLAVFETQAVHITPEQGTEVLDIACDMFPLNGRVTLLCDLWSFLLESLEPLRDLLTPGSQLLQGEHLLLIGVDAPLSLPL
jgi:hypothetical protein